MIYIDLIFGLVGVIYGPYLFLKGKGKRSKPVGIIIFLLGLSFLFSVISVLLILLNIENLSLTFFISGLIALVISIILFIIEITISSRSLRVHITDVENEDN